MSAALQLSQRTVFQPLDSDISPRVETGAQGGLPPGTLLNSIYEVRQFLARGGMGEVYEGVNVNTDERVAIKVMLPHLAADEKIQAMFRKEARILTELAHPALVRYRVLAQEPQLGLFYIVTEFIDGRSLAEVLGQIKPSVAELKALTTRLAGGLAAAHAHGAVHRDIAPDNVLLPNGKLEHAKIIDFGIAREASLTQQTVVGDGFAGKLGFVAPEQFGDFGRRVGPWTDVYSLGLVVLALAAGKAPDMGHTLVDAVDRRREGVDLSPLPAALKPVFEKMLAPNPTDRWQSMAEVIEALDRPEAAVIPTRPVPMPHAAAHAEEAPEPPPRRSRALLFVGAGSALALGVGFLAALNLGASPPPKPVVVPVAETAPIPEAVAILEAQPIEAAPEALVPIETVKAAPVAPRARTPRLVAQTALAAPVLVAAAPIALPPVAQLAARPAAETETAAPATDVQACWRAAGAGWSYIGYASRPSCAAQAFASDCEVIHARWGKEALRRYDGKIQVKGTGALARWKTLSATTCPVPATPAR